MSGGPASVVTGATEWVIDAWRYPGSIRGPRREVIKDCAVSDDESDLASDSRSSTPIGDQVHLKWSAP